MAGAQNVDPDWLAYAEGRIPPPQDDIPESVTGRGPGDATGDAELEARRRPPEDYNPPLPDFSYSDEAERLPDFDDDSPQWTQAERVEAREPVPTQKLRLLPWSAICHLTVRYQTGRTASASGFLIHPRIVATSAHVLHYPDRAYGFAWRIDVSPGHIQPDLPRVSERSETFERNPNWGTSPSAFLAEHDYGVIILRQGSAFAGPRFGILPWGPTGPMNLASTYTVSGYPASLTGQWRHSDKLRGAQGQRAIRYDIVTSPGQSGSPVLGAQSGGPVVFGVHSKKSTDGGGGNIARKVTSDMITHYQHWGEKHGVFAEPPLVG